MKYLAFALAALATTVFSVWFIDEHGSEVSEADVGRVLFHLAVLGAFHYVLYEDRVRGRLRFGRTSSPPSFGEARSASSFGEAHSSY
jgi:hypothetical protein